MKLIKKIVSFSFLAIMVTALTACGESSQQPRVDVVDTQLSSARSSLNALKGSLNPAKVQLPNALLLLKYRDIVVKSSPEFAEVVNLVAKEATPSAVAIQNKEKELKEATVRYAAGDKNQKTAMMQKSLEKALRIKAFASDYNNVLIDSINVVAGLSKGKLAKIEQPTRDASTVDKPMSEYVGNPNYGHWREESNGTSTWQWIAMYAMFSNMNHQPYYRSSYYNHYGGYSYFDRYSSSYERPAWKSNYNRSYRDSKYLSSNPKAFNTVKARGRVKNSAFVSSRKANVVSKTAPSRGFSQSAGRITSASRAATRSASLSRNTSSFRSSSRSGGFGGRRGK